MIIKPCSKCQSTHSLVVKSKDYISEKIYWVLCFECRNSGETRFNRNEAVEVWNVEQIKTEGLEGET